MQNLAQLKRQSNPLVVRGASANTAEAGAADSAVSTLAVLDPTKVGSQAKHLESTLRRVIIGHDEAVRQIVRTYQVYLAGLCPVDRPIGNFLFVGPPGSGKTRAVEAVAEALLGNPGTVIRIDCAEFQHSYEITKLIGSPSGCPGSHRAHSVLTEKLLNQPNANSLKPTVLLFNNVEKASDALWNRLLGILGHATLTLADNRKVDFSKAFIFMTSTVVEMNDLVSRKRGGHGAERNSHISRSRANAGRLKFPSEFLDHLDRIVTFKASRNEVRILQMELRTVQLRIQTSTARRPFFIDVSNSARQFLLAEGAGFRRGAGPLKRVIEQLVVQPLSNLISTGQIHTCDRIRITHIGASPSLTFLREVDASEEWAVDGAVA